ncbi:sulfatase [Halorientalis halophila]|uniref:sulfatase n=1 Tax=Halorientalis halophila TaxID=3108499 RepID=UPI00300A56CA
MKPNILLIVMDSVRAHNLSLYGHEHDTTPFLREFSDRATVYTQARAPGTFSLTSHASMFTGHHVVEHRVPSRKYGLEPGHTIWDELRNEYGYETGVFSQNTFITDEAFGLASGFETRNNGPPLPDDLPFPEALDFRGISGGNYAGSFRKAVTSNHPVRSLLNGVATVVPSQYLPDGAKARRGNTADVYTDYFLDWHDDRDQQWAACLNFMDAHARYLPKAKHDKWGNEWVRQKARQYDSWTCYTDTEAWSEVAALEAMYDGAIHQVDAQLERLLTELENRGNLDETLVVITSDHGETFGEQSLVRPGVRLTTHGIGIHETLLHVPLVTKHPNQTEGAVIEDLSTLTAFPAAVRSAVEGEGDRERFCPDGPVLATSTNIDYKDKRELKEIGINDFEKFEDWAHAIYTKVDNSIQKHATWGDDAATISLPDGFWPFKLSSRGDDRVNRFLEMFEDAGLCIDLDGDVDDETVQQLQDLGYF